MTRRITDVLRVVVAFLVPLGLSAVWVPVRTRLPNADLALVLVLAVLGVGAAGRRLAVLTAAVSAAFCFDFFATRSYEHRPINRTLDLETTLVLALVAMVGGEMAIRIVRHRSRARTDEASSRASAELRRCSPRGRSSRSWSRRSARNCSASCRLSPAPSRWARPTRPGPASGAMVRWRRPGWSGSGSRCGFGARSRCRCRDTATYSASSSSSSAATPRPSAQDLVAAIALGDQVGAAFMTQAPTPPGPADEPARSLRVVQ